MPTTNGRSWERRKAASRPRHIFSPTRKKGVALIPASQGGTMPLLAGISAVQSPRAGEKIQMPLGGVSGRLPLRFCIGCGAGSGGGETMPRSLRDRLAALRFARIRERRASCRARSRVLWNRGWEWIRGYGKRPRTLRALSPAFPPCAEFETRRALCRGRGAGLVAACAMPLTFSAHCVA